MSSLRLRRIIPAAAIVTAITVSALATWVLVGSVDAAVTDGSGPDGHTLDAPMDVPVRFEANAGQADTAVLYLARGPGYNLFLTADGVRFQVGTAAQTPATTLNMQFVGASDSPETRGEGALRSRSNYFKGSDPTRWLSNIPHFSRVIYDQVYPGIDWVARGGSGPAWGLFEYDFIVGPGAKPGRIVLRLEGIDRLELSESGDLMMHTGDRFAVQHRPIAFQEVDGVRGSVTAQFEILGPDTFGFAVGPYDRNLPLVIDPSVDYSTFLGGGTTTGPYGAHDYGEAIAVDSSGNAYIVGETYATDYPVSAGAYQTTYVGGYMDVFVTKIDTSASGAGSLVYSTYLGGNGSEYANDVAIDSSGQAYVAGRTSSTSTFPVTGGVVKGVSTGTTEAFVTVLNSSGTGLVYSTLVGGSGGEYIEAIDVDSSGNAYVAGYTSSSDFPIVNGYQSSLVAKSDIFVARLNSTGTSIDYSTYLAGSDYDYAYGIAADSSGNVYVVGNTESTDFPVTGSAYQSSLNANGWWDDDAFLTKLDTNQSGASSLVYSTYLGGTDYEYTGGVAVDGSGVAYIAGSTRSETDFPTTARAFQTELAGDSMDIDAWIAVIDTTLSATSSLLYSTYIGGTESDSASGIALDSSGQAFITGKTESTDFPTASPIQTADGGATGDFDGDAFVMRMDTNQTSTAAVIYSTYLGGENLDRAYGIGVDAAGNAYVAGYTESANFPVTASAYQGTYAGPYRDAFLTRIDSSLGSGPGEIQFSATGYHVSEYGCGEINISVTRSGGSSGVVSANYGTSDGTATAPADYQTRSGTATFQDGDAFTKTFTVTINDDHPTGDANETVNLTLSSPTGGATLGATSTAVITIADSGGIYASMIQSIEPFGGAVFEPGCYPIATQVASWVVPGLVDPMREWNRDDATDEGNQTGGDDSDFIDADSRLVMAMDTSLLGPVRDFSTKATVLLQFKTAFTTKGNAVADVDVSVNGGAWSNVWRNTTGISGPFTAEANLTSKAAGEDKVLIRFHYYTPGFDGWWQVDDVQFITTAAPAVPSASVWGLLALAATLVAGGVLIRGRQTRRV